MRVLHIGKFWPPYAGGIERFVASLCGALADRGVEADALAHATPGSSGQSHGDNGVRVELIRCHGQLAYVPLSPGFPFALARMLRDRKPDLLHLHMPNPAAFWALALPAARRIPWIVHWHSDIPVQQSPWSVRAAYPLYRPWEHALLRGAERIIATSPSYRDASAPLAPHLAKTEVIPLGLAADTAPDATSVAAARALWPEGGTRLLAVGRLSHYKGFDQLLRALAHTRAIHLLLIGAGECDTELRQLAVDLKLGDRARFAGPLDDRLRNAAYAAADMFCLPSIARSEAFGLVLLEAMRARLPIVASDIPGSGITHVVDGGSAGLLAPPGNVPALAAELARLAADVSLRDRLAAAGHARWQSQFTLDAVADSVLSLYRRTLGKA